jgi:predicted transcriptional regulator
VKERRTVYEIYWEILVYCKKPRLFTQIVQRCDLNSKTCQSYLDFLLNKGYIRALRESEHVAYETVSGAKDYLVLFGSTYLELYGAPMRFRIRTTRI